MFDVDSRLAEGHPAVDRIERYVRACELVGYREPDLTSHAGQVGDWFGTEDGLNLNVLQSDCAALQGALVAAEQALTVQDDQLTALAGAWQGRGADGSRAFLLHHGDASAQLVADLRQAADALAALREDLWQIVDGKVAAAQAIDDRRMGERSGWLAAADAVATGTGDRAAASEMIDQQVRPFVDNDIRVDWVTAMRTATAAVAASYDAVIARLAELPAIPFQVPGELGPSWNPPPVYDIPQRFDDGGSGPATSPAAATVTAGPLPGQTSAPPPIPVSQPMPAAPALGPAWPMTPAAPAFGAAEPMSAAPAFGGAEPMPAAPAMPSSSGFGGGLPSVGSGFAGLGQQIADVLGGLFGSIGEAGIDSPDVADPPLPDEPEADQAELDAAELGDADGDDAETGDDEPGDDETGDTEPEDNESEDTEPEDSESGQQADDTAEATAAEETVATEPVPAEPAPTPVPPPPVAAPPVAPPAAPTGGDTPCEIAADELPQVGQ